MTCGIYKLTFSSGCFYIGKSIDIEKRWKQHFDSMAKGTHTKLLQAEYNRYGYPEKEIIFECHVDHIDIMEESLIARMRPPLNGTFPADRLGCAKDEHLEQFFKYFDMSTMEHIAELHNGRNTIIELTEGLKECREDLGNAMRARSSEEVKRDTDKRIRNANRLRDIAEEDFVVMRSQKESIEYELARVREEVKNFKKLSWWQRLFY